MKIINLIKTFSLVTLLGGTISLSSLNREEHVSFSYYDNGDAETYYQYIDDSLRDGALLKELQGLNKQKRQSTVGYKNMPGLFKYTDYVTTNIKYDKAGQPYNETISSFYTYTPSMSFNREHVWPNTHGGGSGSGIGQPYIDADIHMVRPTISKENSNRGHSFYTEGMSDNEDGWDPKAAGYNENSRGEAARIIMYCVVADPRLVIVDDESRSRNTKNNEMGTLSTILKWNIEYPVTEREINRNEGAEYLQGNRNPFVDHPEWGCYIWGNTNERTREICKEYLTTISVTGVSLDKEKEEIKVGSKLQLNATISPENATNKKVTWTSSNTSVAAVNTSGLVTAKGEGEAIITVTSDDGDFTDTCLIKVNKNIVNVNGVSLDQEEIDLEIEDTCTLNATITPSNATNKNISWSSDDEEVAVVDENGTITAIKEGEAIITVTTEDGGYKDTCVVNVQGKTINVKEVSLNKDEVELEIGDSIQLTATVLPEDATNKNVTWDSDDDSIVEVDDKGLITAKKIGEAIITVTTEDGGHEDTTKVIVKDKKVDPEPTPTPEPTPEPVTPDKPSAGCSGSLIATSSLISITSLIGLVLLINKRKNK